MSFVYTAQSTVNLEHIMVHSELDLLKCAHHFFKDENIKVTCKFSDS